MRPEQRFLLVCTAVGCVSLVAVAISAPMILRIAVTLPLVFMLPGAALLRALDLRFTPSAQVPIVIGLSMALAVLSGLGLNWFGGLTPFGWAAWLSGFSMLAATAALRFRTAGVRREFPAVRFRHGVMLAATAAVLVLTVQGTLRANAAYRPFPHTSFWMVPLVADSTVYVIGIKNDEIQPESYAVQLMVGQRVTGEWQGLNLAPGQTISYPVTVKTGAPAEAWLYRMEQPNVIYRKVTVAGSNEDGRTDSSGTAIADSANGMQ